MAAEGSVAERIKDLQFLLSMCQVLELAVERLTCIASLLITGGSALLEFRQCRGSIGLHLERGTVFSCGDDGT